jgi:ketosteroid isomerase-like protein
MVRISRTSIVLILLASLAFPQSAKRHTTRTPAPTTQQKQQFADDMKTINNLHDRDIRASMALDADELEALWTDDIVTIHPGGPPISGKQANSKKLREGIEQMKSEEILAYNEQFQEVRISGDYAFEYGTITGRTRPFSGGKETAYEFNVLRVLQRLPDGTWKIARSIYNDALPPAAQPKPAEAAKPPEDKNKLKD